MCNISGVFAIILTISYFVSKSKIKKILLDTTYVFTGDYIEKVIPKGENIKMIFKDIISFQKQKKSLFLKTENKQMKILDIISDFEVLENLLEQKMNSDVE